jgi:hypothetical protein
MINHSGPFFERWRRRTLASFGVILPAPPDDQ